MLICAYQKVSELILVIEKSLNYLRILCGLKQGGCKICEKLKSNLVKRGFTQSEVDPCTFWKKNFIVLCCADDYLLLAQDQKLVKDSLSSFQEDVLCTDKGATDGHLGAET